MLAITICYGLRRVFGLVGPMSSSPAAKRRTFGIGQLGQAPGGRQLDFPAVRHHPPHKASFVVVRAPDPFK